MEVLDTLAGTLADTGRTVMTASNADAGIDAKLSRRVMNFPDHDAAIEWCEEQLLRDSDRATADGRSTRLEDFDLLDGLGDAELTALSDVVEIRDYDAGTVVFREGDIADAMFFLLSGRVNVLLPLDTRTGERSRRLAAFGQGVAFGEMALLDEGRRSADVVCDESCSVAVLSLDALHDLDEKFPTISQSIQANLARLLSRRLRAANAQIRALAH